MLPCSGVYTSPVGPTNRKIPVRLSTIQTPGVILARSMAGLAGNASIRAATACQVTSLLKATSPPKDCSTTTASQTSALEAETCPRSHNAAASRNTEANSTPKAINSDAENKGDPTNEVAIRESTLSATSEPASRDVDASI